MNGYRFCSLLLAFVLLAGMCGCSILEKIGIGEPSSSAASSLAEALPEPDPEYPVEAGGGVLASRPGRIVSLSPSLTAKLYDLGQQERLCGISDFCLPPEDGSLDLLPRCGTAQLPDLEAIAELDAHLLLSETELSRENLEALQEMEVAAVVLPRSESVEELLGTYTAISMLLDGRTTGAMFGERFRKRFEDRLASLSDQYLPLAQEREGGPKKALYLRLLDYTVATGGTLENELMELVGLENIAADKSGWNYPAEDAKSEAGLTAFRSIDVIYCDERYVTIKMLEKSDYYKSLQAVLKDWYLYIDCTHFERQSLAMLDELEKMAEYAYGG